MARGVFAGNHGCLGWVSQVGSAVRVSGPVRKSSAQMLRGRADNIQVILERKAVRWGDLAVLSLFGESRRRRIEGGRANLGPCGLVSSRMRRMIVASLVMLLMGSEAPTALSGAAKPAQARGSAWARAGLSRPQARLMAERGAQVVAARNLLVRESGAPQYVTSSYRHVSGVVSGHRYLRARYLADGGAVVVVQRPWLR